MLYKNEKKKDEKKQMFSTQFSSRLARPGS